jgi:SAM-dependent methyltransferase
MKTERTYFAADVDGAVELDRLQDLEAANDPATIRRLEDIGVTHGWRCLEVGAGAGSIARWLSDRVGPTGLVVAADMDPRFLGPLSDVANVEIRRLDITCDPLDDGLFDLVHCRMLLMHLDDPSAALRRMAAALRPDGVLLVEEPDNSICAPADLSHPRSATVLRVQEALRSALANRRIFDPTLGRRLPRLLEGAGLRLVENEGVVRIVRGPSIRTRLARKTLSRFRDLVLQHGVSTDEWDTFIGAYDDPTFEMVGLMVVQAWGWR